METITSIASWKVVNNNTIMADNNRYSNDDSFSHRQVVLQNEINENDVLSGRGGWVHQCPGNIQYRRLLRQYKQRYNEATERGAKTKVVQFIVESIQSMDPPGRFLKEGISLNSNSIDKHGSLEQYVFVELDDKDAVYKTRKAIRNIGSKVDEKKTSRPSTPLSSSSNTTDVQPVPLESSIIQQTFQESFTSVDAFLDETARIDQLPSTNTAAYATSTNTSYYNSAISLATTRRREQFYTLRNEPSSSFLLPSMQSSCNRECINHSDAGSKVVLRTYSDERSKLMKESKILSASSIMTTSPNSSTSTHVKDDKEQNDQLEGRRREQQEQSMEINQDDSSILPPPLPLLSMSISPISASMSSTLKGEDGDHDNNENDKNDDHNEEYMEMVIL